MLTYGSELLKKTATQSFWNSYANYPDPFAGLVYERPSTQETDVYARLGAAPMPRVWNGAKVAKPTNEYSYSVTNYPYEASVPVDKKLIKFQQWDEIGSLIGNLGAKTRAHRTKLLSDALMAGFATVCEDGQYFIDDDHTDPGGYYTTNQDNALTSAAATGTQPTDLEMATGIRACFDAMYGFKDDQGDPMVPDNDDPASFVVMVPPAYRSVSLRVQLADALTGPVGNDLKGRFVTRVNPFLTDVDRFYFLYAGSNHKPLITQLVQDVEIDDNMTGDDYFNTGNVT